MAKRGRLRTVAALAGGAIAGAAVEELVYRRVFGVDDPEADEPIGSVPGRTRWVETFDGTRLYGREYGPADAAASIVFAHGVTENHVIWHYVIRELRADGRYKLVAYDARGHGNSGPVHGPDGTTRFDGTTLGKDLAAVVRELTDGPVVVVGHSLGGMTALAQLILERKERERIEGAVVVNSTYTSNFPGWKGRISSSVVTPIATLIRRALDGKPKRVEKIRFSANDLAFLYARAVFGRGASPRQVAVAFNMFHRTPAQTLVAAIDLLEFNVTDDLAKIDVPLLVVAGSRDTVTPFFLSKDLVEAVPGAELVVLQGCGHMAPFERYEDLTAHIRKFAERVLP